MAGIAVRGIGVLMPFAEGADAFRRALSDGMPGAGSSDCRVPEVDLERHLSGAGRFRRAAPVTRYALAAAAMAVADAGMSRDDVAGERTGLVASITHGALDYTARFHAGLLGEGPAGASPLFFAESVLNAPAGNVSIAFGIRGPVHTVVGEETSGVQAIALAAALLRSRAVDRCLVIGTEERAEIADRVYGELVLNGGEDAAFPPGEGSVSLLLARDDPDGAGGGGALLFPEVGAFGGPARDGAAECIARVVGGALARAGLTAKDVGHVVLPTGHHRASARRALAGCFGTAARAIDIGALAGNARGAAGVLQVAASACALTITGGAGLALATGIEGTVAAVALRPARAR